jgi:DNA-binding transcriptional LysR family regulator
MSTPPPEIAVDDLRALIAIARAGRMTSASIMLGIDHTTVRRRVTRLERALGARLVDRGADGWELTDLGRRVVEESGELDRLIDRIARVAAGDSETVRGVVRVITPEGFGVAFAAPALARVCTEHPDVRVELVTSTRPLSTRGAGFDLAVTIGASTDSRLLVAPLADYALRLYAAPEYLARTPPVRTADDLAEHSLVFYVDALLSVRELDLVPSLGGMRVSFGSTNVAAQLEATRRGAGIGLLHAFGADREPGLVPVLADEVEFRRRFLLAMRRESADVPAVAVVRDALLAEVRTRSDELLPGG